MKESTTLGDLLARAAANAGHCCVIQVARDGSEQAQSYAELYVRAQQTLAFLQTHGVHNGRTLVCQLASSTRQLEVFWACVLGGIIPVLLPKVTSWQRDSEAARKLLSVCATLTAPTILLDPDQSAACPAHLPAGMSAASCLVDQPEPGNAQQARIHHSRPDDLAYLQFSSGSTGIPKGVRLTHRNIVCNIAEIAAVSAMHADEIMLSWMPYFHDMGLVGFHLVPMYLGITQIKMEAAHFIARPLLWLRKIHQHRATLIGCPNFGLQHVLDRLASTDFEGLDLSCVRLLFNGAEPISAAVMRRFTEQLAATGFRRNAMYPVYGMAEACLAVTFSPPGEEPRVLELDRNGLINESRARPASETAPMLEYVDVGSPLPSIQLRIVDECGAALDQGCLGEVVIRGTNVTAGYEGLGERNRELFTADGWLRTGDMGFLRDGRLTITGRIKDVIFINGRNVMAVDLEMHLAQRFNLSEGQLAACGVNDLVSGRECVVIFLRGGNQIDYDRLRAIQSAAEEYLVFPIECVLSIKQLPRTSSGKIQRYKLVQEWQSGAFDELVHAFKRHAAQAEHISKVVDATQNAVREIWAAVLQCDSAAIDIDRSFVALGGTSVRAIEMLSRLEEHFKTSFGYALLIDCRTVRDIALYIDTHQGKARSTLSPTANAHAGRTAIAVIGMAGRFPGAATIDAFWRNLCDGIGTEDTQNHRWCDAPEGFHLASLADIDLFASDFFAVSDDEAAVMDPQQRLMLEVAYEALDNAGCNGARLGPQRSVGIYLGVSYNGYLEEIIERRRREGPGNLSHMNLMPANLLNMVAARIAHTLDLKGPALVFDSACSSSLVALHYACNDLLLGNCEVAVVGGVNLMLTPTGHELFAQAGALSPDGVCRAFDTHANGMVPGEGLGAVILKRLDRALADGDRIDAIVAGTAVNNDGRSIGILAPAPEGQEAVLRRAYASAGIEPSQVDYVEAHGTGTPVGDPIEMRALRRVFAERTDQRPCGIGSVKTNIGHLLAAAGIAGLIKVLLSLRHQQLPPTLHLQTPHPRARVNEPPFYPVTSLTAWPRTAAPRYAGISAFGFGGTNAHVVVADHAEAARCGDLRHHHLLCVSARNVEELALVRANLAAHLRAGAKHTVGDLCYTYATGRATFAQRQCFVVSGIRDLLVQLECDASVVAASAPKKAADVAWLFRALDHDAVRHSHALYHTHIAYREAFDQCVALANRRLGANNALDFAWLSTTAVVGPASDSSGMQALLFSVSYALAHVWLSAGVRPAIVVGDGIGEIAAACIAGAVGLDDAIALAIVHPTAGAVGDAQQTMFAQVVSTVQFGAPSIALCNRISTTNAPIDHASYWTERLHQSRPISDSMQELVAMKIASIIDIGTCAYLDSRVDSVREPHGPDLAPRESAEVGYRLMSALGRLWLQGHPIDWVGYYRGCDARIVELPSYPMQRRHHWLPQRRTEARPMIAAAAAD